MELLLGTFDGRAILERKSSRKVMMMAKATE
jgi:hypothetical protein